MSKASKIAFFCAFVLMGVVGVIQLITGGWINLNTVFVAIAAGCVAFAIIWDWKLYYEFFTMRTTKHGMNMGLLIVLTIVAVFCLNYLANKNNKTWDLTQEKANSLSDQTMKVLAGLKKDLDIKVFYTNQDQRTEEQKGALRQQLQMYKDNSGKVRSSFINANVEQEQAAQYLSNLSDARQGGVFAFVEYGGKKIRIDEPYSESTLTSAIIKATREGESKVYFVKGHGERDIAGQDAQGMHEFVRQLEEASFKVEALDLIEKKQIPEDAKFIAIVGPSVPFLDGELDLLRNFVAKGGRLFVALDPGSRHNLANLVKPLGVEFPNNYVVNFSTQVVGGGPATVIGRNFDTNSSITKSIPAGADFAVFPLASELKPAPDKPGSIEVKEIVKADPSSFTVVDLGKPPQQKPETKAVTIAVEVKGTVAKAEGKADAPELKPFEAVIFGDSDFLSNRALMVGVNRDLGMNAFAQLANQQDLLSIRPKLAKGTVVTLTGNQKLFIVIAGLCLPVLLLVASAVMWFRRRGA